MASSNNAERIQEDLMEIDTRFGKQAIAKSSLLTFPDGIPGFEHLRDFTLLHEEDTLNLHFLQATEDVDVRLPVVTPDACRIDFRIELSDSESETLAFQPGDDVLVLLTLSNDQDQPDSGIKANLMGPIIINTRSRIGLQKVLNQVDGAVVIDAS